MSESDELEPARQQFAAHVQAEEAIMNSSAPSAARANKHVEATDALVDEWADRGIVKKVLVPLLDSPEAALRCAAASYLLYHGESERAAAILEELASDDSLGSVASSADTALLAWEQE